MPHISFKIKAESISTFGTNGLIDYVIVVNSDVAFCVILFVRNFLRLYEVTKQ